MTILLQRCADGVDDAIDISKTLPLAGFLGLRDAPGSFPSIGTDVSWVFRMCLWDNCSREGRIFRHMAYQRRPPRRGDVGLNMLEDWRAKARDWRSEATGRKPE